MKGQLSGNFLWLLIRVISAVAIITVIIWITSWQFSISQGEGSSSFTPQLTLLFLLVKYPLRR